MYVSEIMQSNPKTIDSESSLYEAAKKMEAHEIGVLPVEDEGRVTGVITDRDIVTRAIAHGKDLHSTSVRDVMTSNPLCCQEDTPIEQVIHKMNKNSIRRILILDEEETLTGILSLGDVARHLHDKELLGELFSQVSVM